MTYALKITETILAQNYEEMVVMLRSIGLTPSTYRGPSGNLLHVIAQFGPAHFVPRLVHDGVDVNEVNGEGDTALHIAARLGRSAVIDQLLAIEGLDDTIINLAMMTPYQSSKNRQISTAIEYSRSLYINRRTKEMHDLVSCGDVSGLREMFSIRRNKIVLNVNSPDSHGDTILHVAARHDHSAELVQLCIELGADPYLKNKKGKLPIELTKDDSVKNILREGTSYR